MTKEEAIKFFVSNERKFDELIGSANMGFKANPTTITFTKKYALAMHVLREYLEEKDESRPDG